MCDLSAEVVRRSVAMSPKSKFRGQGIHTVISLHNLRAVSLENISPDHHLHCTIKISLHDANLHTHGPKYCQCDR